MALPVLAVFLVGLAHAVQGNIDLNLSDEGFLWNGTLRIGQGKIPIRDYKSYDPGRHYWCFAWSKLFGQGILGIRRAAAVFQALGLWAGLEVATRATENVWLLGLTGLILLWWMQPRHKLFEHTVSLITVYVAVLLIESPTLEMMVLAGACVGFAGFMGRNLGAYTFCAFACLILLITLKGGGPDLRWSYGAWALGILAGYAPMLAMWALIPGLFRRYWTDKVMIFLRIGTLNRLPVPVPWPWRTRYGRPRLGDRLSAFFLGVHFLLLPLFYVTALVWIALAPSLGDRPLLTAGAFVGVFYMHHAFTRADLAHLCQVMQPFLLCVLSIAFAQENTIATAALLGALMVAGFVTARPLVPLMNWWDNRKNFVTYDLNGEPLRIPQFRARFIDRVRVAVAQNLGPDEAIFIAPRSPTLYPILGKQTPVRSDYLLFPETEPVQGEIIADLERNHVDWALIADTMPDLRETLRFRNTHPLVWDYLQANFEPVPAPGLGKAWQFLRRKDRLGTGANAHLVCDDVSGAAS